jgi:hypothetical protein
MIKFRDKFKLLFIALILGSLSIFIKDATPSAISVPASPSLINMAHDVWRVNPTSFLITPEAMQEVYRSFGPQKGEFKATFQPRAEGPRALQLKFIPQGHVLERMGFQNGDQLWFLNGKEVSSLKGLNGLFFVLSKPHEIMVQGVHAGQPFLWKYTVSELIGSKSGSTIHDSNSPVVAPNQPLDLINPFFYLSNILHVLF